MEDYVMNSPKSSDSLDGELVGIAEWNRASNLDGSDSRRLCHLDLVKHEVHSDEDTEDASEDGGGDDRHDVHAMKEQMYFHKLELLKARLEELEYGRHPEFVKGLAKIEELRAQRLRNNEACREYEASCIEHEYMNEKKKAILEFEKKKNELKNGLINEWEEKKRQIEQERYSIELSAESVEAKPPTRKLRRRPNDPNPVITNNDVTINPTSTPLTFVLDNTMIEEDFEAYAKAIGKLGAPTETSCHTNVSISPPIASEATTPFMNSRIEDGKLYYEKKWFHRGQTVYVEGIDLPSKVSGVICSISQDTIWIRKVADQSKFRVMLYQLMKGVCAIKRRP